MGVWRGWVPLPADWNPWAPLDVRASPNLLTRYKLGRLQDDPVLCDLVLETSGLWPGEGDKARFLRQVRDGACDDFNGVLSPDIWIGGGVGGCVAEFKRPGAGSE